MTYDFSHLYKNETVEVKSPAGEIAFTVVVREITHGEKTAAQSSLTSAIDIPMEGSKQSRQRIIKQRIDELDKGAAISNVSLKQEVAAIQSWDLVDAKGEPVPVCLEAWKALPVFYTSQIEPVIERLNPEMDDEFHSGSGSNGTE
jgi:hypothetical protein